MTILEYYKSKILPGIRIAGQFESITDASPSIYASLKKNGFAFVCNSFTILPKDVVGLKSFFNENESSFQRLFTDFKRGGSDPIFLSLKGPGRYVATTPAVIDSVILTSDIEKRLLNILGIGGFPKHQQPFFLQWSVLKSDPHLQYCQHSHCDSEIENQYYKSSQFRFSCMIGLEEYTFLDIKKPKANTHQRILIESGDVLFFRNDIAHRGTQNNSDFTHYRLHCFIDPVALVEKKARYSVVDAVPFIEPN